MATKQNKTLKMIDLRLGDCLEVLKTIPDNSIDSIITDPPYHLTSIVKRFGKEGSAPAQFGTDGAYAGFLLRGNRSSTSAIAAARFLGAGRS